MPGPSRSERVARAQRLREEGLLLREIAESLGCSLSTAQAYLSDPDNAKARARKDSYRQACIGCGTLLNGSNGRGPRAAKRCRTCARRANAEAQAIRTRAQIITAIHKWAAEQREPPAISDWRRNGGAACARLFDEGGGRWPASSTVIRVFGTWNAAIIAAGLAPRVAGGSHENSLRRRGARYWTRDRVVAAIRSWVAEHGEAPRSVDWNPSDARRRGDVACAQRFEDGDGRWPSSTTVHKVFGAWNRAIAAAGFEPRAPHRPRSAR